MKIYLSVLLFTVFNISFACSCAGKQALEKALDETNVVISGKVLSKELFTKKESQMSKYFAAKIKYKILVTKVHKGKIQKNIVTILTGQGMGGDCGYFFQTGMTYTIYADYSPINISGKKLDFLETNICTRTAKFNKTESNKIEMYCKSKGYS